MHTFSPKASGSPCPFHGKGQVKSKLQHLLPKLPIPTLQPPTPPHCSLPSAALRQARDNSKNSRKLHIIVETKQNQSCLGAFRAGGRHKGNAD